MGRVSCLGLGVWGVKGLGLRVAGFGFVAFRTSVFRSLRGLRL